MLASIRRFLWRLIRPTRRSRSQSLLQHELEFHLQMETEENVRKGMSQTQARRNALIALGGIEQTKEAYRETNSIKWLDEIWQDASYGIRMLRKNPGFASVAVITLAIGIGASTAIFSVVNGVLLRPLPYDRPEELVLIRDRQSGSGLKLSAFTPQDYRLLRDDNRVFQNVAIFRLDPVDFTGNGDPERLVEACASSEVFTVLRAKASLGRVYGATEDIPGQARVVLLSDHFWRRRFNANPTILGEVLILDDEPCTVLGVMPPDFDFPSGDTDLWTPFNTKFPADFYQQGGALVGQNVIARLNPGVSLEQAAGNIHGILGPKKRDGWSEALIPLNDYILGEARPVLMLLFGAVGFVLLAACSNVANLLSIRGESRSKEIAVRAALGASTARLFKQSFTESTLLSFVGGGLGLMLAFWIKMALIRLGPSQIPRLEQVDLDGTVIGFSLLTTMLATVVAGLLPALKVPRNRAIGTARQSGTNLAGGTARTTVSRILVVSELALALILLTGAGLMIRSVLNLLNLDLGFNPKNVLIVEIPRSPAARITRMSQSESNEQIARRRALFQEVAERIQAIPGVESVGATSQLPLQEPGFRRINAIVDGVSGKTPSAWADSYMVTPGYFRTMGMQLVKGRVFDEKDRRNAPLVAVIDQTLAQRFWPEQDPIGKRLECGNELIVIGVVHNTRSYGLRSRRSGMFTQSGQIFLPIEQVGPGLSGSLSAIVVRTALDPLKHIEVIRAQVWQLNRDQPVSRVVTLESQVADFTAPPRFLMMLLAAFATVALILGTIGIYGVTSNWVTRRTNEIGIRMAVGAGTGDILRMVLGQSLVLTIGGLTLGLAGAFALTRFLAGMIFGLTTTDPNTFLTVVLLFGLTSIAAALIPGRRATRVDPVKALRCE